MKKITKRLWEKKNSKKGFTLVELIVVLVILAILAAIMVPALLGWIDKAKEKEILLEGRSVYLAAQTYASEEYGKSSPSQSAITSDEGIVDIEALAGVEGGTVSGIAFEGSSGRKAFIVNEITYTSGGLKATYKDGQWTVTDANDSSSDTGDSNG